MARGELHKSTMEGVRPNSKGVVLGLGVCILNRILIVL